MAIGQINDDWSEWPVSTILISDHWSPFPRGIVSRRSEQKVREMDKKNNYTFLFISTPFFSAQPGVAYREAVFQPQACLNVCLTNQRIFVQ